MEFTRADGKYYEFFASKGGKTYTIRTYEHKVVYILVEQPESFDRKLYQRGQAKIGLIINKDVFEETLLAICGNSLSRWSELYMELYADEEYVYPIMENVFKKHFSI